MDSTAAHKLIGRGAMGGIFLHKLSLESVCCKITLVNNAVLLMSNILVITSTYHQSRQVIMSVYQRYLSVAIWAQANVQDLRDLVFMSSVDLLFGALTLLLLAWSLTGPTSFRVRFTIEVN